MKPHSTSRFTRMRTPFVPAFGAGTNASLSILTASNVVSNNSKSKRRKTLASVRKSSAYARLDELAIAVVVID